MSWAEQERRRKVTEEAAARYRRLVRLNEAEAAIERSRAVDEELERARLAREARERRERIAEAERRAAAQKAAAAAEAAKVAEAVKTLEAHLAKQPAPKRTPRQQPAGRIERRDGERIEYRAFDEEGRLYGGDV